MEDIVKKLIKGVKEFPTLPTIYTALSEVMSNPYSTPSDAANIICSDQSSASKILKAANSPIYALKSRVGTITDAIFYVGFEEVKNLILAMSVINLFRKTELLDDYNPIDLWKHSIAVGVVTRIIGAETNAPNLENYFVTGILHDIGKLLFIKNLETQYSDVLKYSSEKKVVIREAEKKLLGVTHNVAGELIADKWKLPPEMKKAIRFHYIGKTDEGFDRLAACVHIADIAARMMDYGFPGDSLVQEPNYEIWDYLSLPKSFFTDYHKKIMLDYETSLNVFSL